jgi:hypothetical protein
MGEGPAKDAGRLAAESADAMLKAGASIARGFAEAVTGRPPSLVPGETALASVVRHTSTGLAGLARILVDAAKAGADGAMTPPAAPAAGLGPLAGPVIAPGGTLRVPLSIDNPGDSEMTGLAPRALAARCDGVEVALPKVRFQPRTLSIAPRDFEKLVLFIDLPPEAAPGDWRLAFSLDGSSDAPAEIGFRVAAVT